jgi:hypothetical protein
MECAKSSISGQIKNQKKNILVGYSRAQIGSFSYIDEITKITCSVPLTRHLTTYCIPLYNIVSFLELNIEPV